MGTDMVDTTAEVMADTVDTMVDTVANDLLMPLLMPMPMPTTDMADMVDTTAEDTDTEDTEAMVDTVMVDTEDIMVEMFSHMIKSLEFKKQIIWPPFMYKKQKIISVFSVLGKQLNCQ